MDKKADLLQSVSVQEQYEKMLLDYAEFLETAQDKLKSDAICARDLDSLKQQLAAHKVNKLSKYVDEESEPLTSVLILKYVLQSESGFWVFVQSLILKTS